RTIQSRLARGRERLRQRLVRRGVGPVASLVAAGLAAEAHGAGPPEAWVQITVDAAVRYAARRALPGAGTAPVAELAKGVQRTMLLDKLKIASALLLVLGAVVVAAHTASPATEAPGDRYKAKMAGGATVEVVAVSTHPSGPGTWWAPDGSPLS